MAIVEAVVSSLVNRLGDHLIREASSLLGVGDQLEWVQSQFRWMQAFLKDADAKSHKDERVKQWMREVRGVAYLAEDIIDTFVLQIAPLRQPGFSGTIKRCAHVSTEIPARNELVSKIEKMKEKINSINQSRISYGIQDIGQEEEMSSAGQSLTDRRRLSSPYVEEPDFVGFQTDMETLIRRLTQGEPRRSVISIVGMGGLGKTTLAKKVYQSDAVKRHFHPCLWISISQVYAVTELLLALVKSCMLLSKKELEKMEKADPIDLCLKLVEHLRGKTYLVVLDDIWSRDAWDALKDAFPDTSNGSRVLLTTRNKDVALRADASSQPHELRFLNEDESWELFLKKAFVGCNASFPIDPEPLRKEILGKCQGLPLAIVAIGGLLSRRKEPTQWQNILASLGWQLIEGEDRISGILSLSYKDLPYYLKPCFLYVGVFPEDKEIPAKKLIRLWVAEGLLQEERGLLTLEQVGEEFLLELIQRCIIQVSARSSSGGIKSCRIHDLLRDLALSEAKKDEFLEVPSGSPATPSTTCTGRRLVLHYDKIRFDSSNFSAPNLRSLLIHSQDYSSTLNRREKKLVYGSFKLLRVLDMGGVRVRKLPSEVGKLIHLRYLDCTCEKLESFSSNIGNLVNLETLSLDYKGDYCKTIPIAVGKMQQLRHVRLRGCGVKITGYPRLDQLPSTHSLQTLGYVLAGKWMNDGSMERLTKLRKLGIHIKPMIRRGSAETAWKSIMRLTSLESLFVTTSSRQRGLGQVPALNHLPKLCKLRLYGKIEEASVLCELPRNLTKLVLNASELEQDPLPILEKLENLRILNLFHCYNGEKMACTAGGFPRLQYLYLCALEELREWRVENGSMPCLSHLTIGVCESLKEVPEGLQHVTSLKTLELRMRKSFMERVRRDGGEDWHKVQHIPSIII